MAMVMCLAKALRHLMRRRSRLSQLIGVRYSMADAASAGISTGRYLGDPLIPARQMMNDDHPGVGLSVVVVVADERHGFGNQGWGPHRGALANRSQPKGKTVMKAPLPCQSGMHYQTMLLP